MKNEAKRQMTKKAIVAVVLVMASLFAMASLVSAGFVEEVFSEVCELMTTSSAGTGGNGHSWRGNGTAGYCQDCHQTIYSQICTACSPAHTQNVCGCKTKPIG